MQPINAITRVTAIALVCGLVACAPNSPETAASPVQTVTRSTERTGAGNQSMNAYDRSGDDGTMMTKVLAPAPQVWEALKATFDARKVNLTILDRAAGRMGDTSLTFTHRWNDKNGSFYFACGESMTGQRADEDRIRAVVLTQMSRMAADTIAIVVHISAFSTPVNMGGSSSSAQCTSTGRGETDFLDEVTRRLGARH